MFTKIHLPFASLYKRLNIGSDHIPFMLKFSLTILIIVILSVRSLAQISDFAGTDFRKADSVAAMYVGHSLKDLKSLAFNLTTPLLTEEEKFRSIYKWVCDNIENDYDFNALNKVKREKISDTEKLSAWNAKFRTRVLEKLFNEQKTVCTGYAYLVMKLSTYAGLTCVIVDGYGRTVQANIGGPGIPNHSWNAIKLHSKWYLCDATWSSGAIDTEARRFVKRFDNAYFLAEPSLFVRNHYPLDSAWLFMKDKPTLQEFLNRPLIYSSIYRYEMAPLFPKTFDVSIRKGEPVSFRFMKTTPLIGEKVSLRIDDSVIIDSQPYLESNGDYCVEYTFKSRGRRVVHIMLDSSYVFSYNVNVK